MKVVHISNNDFTGAGLCASRINDALNSMGVDSNMLVLVKKSNQKSIHQVKSLKYFINRVLNKSLRLCGLQITDLNKVLAQSRSYHSTYTLPSYVVDLSNHPLILAADIIHLHWVNNFLDVRKLFLKMQKPIVWTLHDENLFYGTAHYQKTRLLEDPLEKKYLELKRHIIPQYDKLGIVFLSNYFFDKFSKNDIIQNAKLCVINNSVNPYDYMPIDKMTARKKNGFSMNQIILAFTAGDITDTRKGLSVLINSVKELHDERIVILAIGDNSKFEGDEKVLTVGLVNDNIRMSELLSSADYFVMPSYQEAFSQSPMEAMACGLPVLCFPVSGTDELINEGNGIVCDDFTEDALINGLIKIQKKKYDPKYIRNYVKDNYSQNVIASQYYDFYKKMLIEER